LEAALRRSCEACSLATKARRVSSSSRTAVESGSRARRARPSSKRPGFSRVHVTSYMTPTPEQKAGTDRRFRRFRRAPRARLADPPDGKDREFVKEHARYGKRDHAPWIGRGEHGGDSEDNDDGIAPLALQESRIDHAHAAEQGEHDRKLENDAEGEN